jgi:NAD(P)-dependent dehydrogenase (short-subunit alcohol dehydrogenase family)
MQSFAGKVAVVTGAANGIGLAIARRCAQERMRLVLADVEAERLHAVCDELGEGGAAVLAVPTDVSEFAQVQRLAAHARESFGRVDLLCNIAGVGVDGQLWTQPLEEWRWIFGVNFWGIVHGIQAFVPLMLAQGGPSHVVNMASVAGLDSGAGFGAYRASKHAAVSLSETLHHELRALGSSIQVSVLCPGLVRTRILEEGLRGRPGGVAAGSSAPEDTPVRRRREAFAAGLAAAMEPEVVADRLFAALRAESLHVLTHSGSARAVVARFRLILGPQMGSEAP